MTAPPTIWTVEPQVLIGLAVLALLYGGAALLMRQRPTRRQLASFIAGLVALLASLGGPIDFYAKDRCFAAYIFQQMLLVFACPPLLMFGLPAWMMRPVMLNRAVEPVARVLTRPLTAFLIFSGVFALIHYPMLCDMVCHEPAYFGSIRVILLVSGIFLWWPLLSPLPEYPRLSYPMQIMYLFLLMIPMTAVGAPITMADSVVYMYYTMGPHPFGLTPMADQVLGGLIMWVGQGAFIMFVFTAIFYRWSRRDDSEIPAFNRSSPRVRAIHP